MNMTARPNPELAAALADSGSTIDYADKMEKSIESLADQARADTFPYRPPTYSRQTYTTAMLLAGDGTLRDMARAKGIDVRAFDNAVGQAQQLILENTNKPTPGAKVATVLRRICGL